MEFGIAMAVFVALIAIAMVAIYFDHKDRFDGEK